MRGRLERHRAIGIQAARVAHVVAERELRCVARDGRVLFRGHQRDVDERVRPDRIAHFVKRDPRHGQRRKQRFVVLDQLAKRA